MRKRTQRKWRGWIGDAVLSPGCDSGVRRLKDRPKALWSGLQAWGDTRASAILFLALSPPYPNTEDAGLSTFHPHPFIGEYREELSEGSGVEER